MNLDEMIRLYTVEHLTCQQIAEIMHCSRAWISIRLKDCGIHYSQGTRVKAKCFTCGKMHEVTRARHRNRKRAFCSRECFYASRKGEHYRPWRQGQRRARAIVAQYFKLEPQHIVHHEDKDNCNNDIRNLRVFACQADHMSYHHGNAVPFLFDGSIGQ